ncbi:hypothetical protein ACJJTC_016529 [Scirpophaga incertulas]
MELLATSQWHIKRYTIDDVNIINHRPNKNIEQTASLPVTYIKTDKKYIVGTVFQIVFEIKDTDVITIYCQGKFHSNFLPKIPLTMARYIVAWADVERVTYCYFHFGNKAIGGDEGTQSGNPQSRRCAMVSGDTKRCQRLYKKSTQESPNVPSSNESRDEDKTRPVTEGRADRYFYETLMCQQPEHFKFLSEIKYRRDATEVKNKMEHAKKYRELTDSEINKCEVNSLQEDLTM